MDKLNHIVLWMWAQQAFGPGNRTPWHIHRNFPGGLEGFYREGPRCWNRLDYVSEVQAESLAACTLEEAMARLDYAMKLGWHVVTPECEQYPQELRNISDPPAVLYSKGAQLQEIPGPRVAVAGARKALPESMDAARSIGYQLATAGGVVVTGEAVGVDGCAMEGVTLAGGRAVCVLPVDLSSPYMAKTSHLRQRVLELGGALVTEYFSQRSPAQGGFQLRNRLITGLCPQVVLVQAAEKSGTMIYARHAAGQGRKLYVFPGPERAEEFAGSRRLLKEGAMPVYSGGEVLGTDKALAPEDIARVAGEPEPVKAPARAAKPRKGRLQPMLADSGREPPAEQTLPPAQELPPEQQAVLDQLDSPRTVDELAEGCGMDAAKLLRLLTRMELQGLVESVPGRRYRRPGR